MNDEARDWQRRVDHRLRALWERVPERDRLRQKASVLVRFLPSCDLAKSGLEVRSVAGDIASCSLMLVDLPQIASAEGVLFIEFAQPLTYDQ